MNALSRLFRFESRTKAALHIDPKKDGFEPSWFELLLELKNFSWAQLGKYQLKLIIIFSVKIQEFSQCTMEPNNNKSFSLLHRGISCACSYVLPWALLYFFMGLHLALIDEPVNSLVGKTLWARIKVNRKTNQPNWPAPPFHSISQPR